MKLLSTISLLSGLIKAEGLIESEKNTKTLVLLDNFATIETHSTFFAHLEQKLGHELDFEMASSKINFRTYDKWRYQNVVLMA